MSGACAGRETDPVDKTVTTQTNWETYSWKLARHTEDYQSKTGSNTLTEFAFVLRISSGKVIQIQFVMWFKTALPWCNSV